MACITNCPFCGAEAYLTDFSNVLACTSCDSEGVLDLPPSYEVLPARGELFPTMSGIRREELIRLLNTRWTKDTL